MIYLALASLMYAWIALDLVEGDAPLTFREALGAAILCATLAAVWPAVIGWRILLGPGRDVVR